MDGDSDLRSERPFGYRWAVNSDIDCWLRAAVPTLDQERAIMEKCRAQARKAYPEQGLVKKRGLASEECFERLDND